MRAMRFDRIGPPDVLRLDEVPDPAPTADQVLVRVTASGANYVDTQVRSGAVRELGVGFDWSEPVIPGNEVVGTTADGRRVLAYTPNGGHADLVALPEDALLPVPDDIDDHTALTLFSSGDTALALIERSGLRAGETVVVEAAAGAVGTLLVQLAVAAGARAVGLARGDRKLALVRDLGATAADYSTPDWADVVREVAPDGVDVVLETVGGSTAKAMLDLLTPVRGRMVLYGFASGRLPEVPTGDIMFRSLTVTGYSSQTAGDPVSQRRRLTELFRLTREGALKPVIGQVLPLEKLAEAHAALETRATVGKTIITHR